jgi:hypothetical protein
MKFIYSGPSSGITLKVGNQLTEVLLHTDTVIDLEEQHLQHEAVLTLKAWGHLVEHKVAPAVNAIVVDLLPVHSEVTA